MQSFVKSPNGADWVRFMQNSRRVRRIKDSREVPARPTFDLTALYEITASRPHSPIFPNLRHIQGSRGSFTFEIFFLQSGPATSLDISVSRPARGNSDLPFPSTYEALFDRIMDRVPSLQRFEINDAQKISDKDANEIANEIPRFINKFSALTVVSLTPCLLTSAVMSSLARLPCLFSLRMPIKAFGVLDGTRHFSNLADVGLDSDSFPSLREISLSAPLQQAQTFFTHKNFPLGNLTKLSLYSTLQEVASHHDPQVHDFLSMLAPVCRNLQQLEFLVECPVIVQDDDSCLTFRDISPILDFPALRKLTLIHDEAIEMTDDEAETLALRWSTLEELSLNPRPILAQPEYASMTLNALIPFCRHCPNLRQLSLFVDAVAPVTVPTNLSALRPLLSFDMGASHLPSCIDRKGWDIIHGTLPHFFARILRDSSSLKFENSSSRFYNISKNEEILRSLISLVMEELWKPERAVKEAKTEVMRQFTRQC